MALFKMKNKKVDLVIDYKSVFETAAGKRVLWDLMKKGHILHTSYHGDYNDTIFREGERNIVNYILTVLKQDPIKLKDFIDKSEEEDLQYVD